MSCSYCNSSRHNIRYCVHPMVGLLCERIEVMYVNIMNQFPHDIKSRFTTVLNRNFTVRELRAVCANRTNLSLSRTKQQIIDILYEYYSTRIYQPVQQEDESSRRLPTHPDPIPDFARDLVQPLEEEEEEPDITWYMDTTPSPVSVISFDTIQDPATEPATLERLSFVQTRELSGGEQLIIRDLISVNLLLHFDAVSGNIYFAPQVNKFNISLVLEVGENEEAKEEEVKGEEVSVEDCVICYESKKCMDFVILNCMHKFCGSCVQETLKSHNKLCGPSCALCRTEMVSFTVKNLEIYNLASEYCNL